MLKVAVVILVIMLACAGVYSLMSIIVPKVVLGITFKSATGRDLDSVQDAGYLKLELDRQKRMGLYVLTLLISNFFVLFVGFRKAQKWAWWCFLIGGGTAWLWALTRAITTGDKLYILPAIGTTIFLVGVLLPVKVFFAKEVEEAREEAREAEEA